MHFPIISTKPTPHSTLSKSGLINWVRSVVGELPRDMTIEDLGTGVVWCKLINVYYPNTIPHNRILLNPKNQYQNSNNFKLLQNAFVQHKITVPLDLNKVAKMKFLQNWALANSLYKHFNTNEDPNEQENRLNQTKTPKRTYEMAFPNEVYRKDHHKQLKQNSQLFNFPIKSNSVLPSPTKGKWSVSSQFFQVNQNAIIDRVKQILLKPSHDIEKVRQIKILLNIPLNEDMVKIEEEEYLLRRNPPVIQILDNLDNQDKLDRLKNQDKLANNSQNVTKQ